jgi:hypothetical protein
MKTYTLSKRPSQYLDESSDLAERLGAIVRTNVLRDSSEQHYVRQRFDHFILPEPSCHSDCQALPRECNLLERVLRPAAKEAGLERVTWH